MLHGELAIYARSFLGKLPDPVQRRLVPMQHGELQGGPRGRRRRGGQQLHSDRDHGAERMGCAAAEPSRIGARPGLAPGVGVRGHRPTARGVGRQARPDLVWLTDYLSRLTSRADRTRRRRTRPRTASPGRSDDRHPAAQFWAALRELRQPSTGPAHAGQPVVADRPWSAEELRLMADRPPHHGS